VATTAGRRIRSLSAGDTGSINYIWHEHSRHITSLFGYLW